MYPVSAAFREAVQSGTQLAIVRAQVFLGDDMMGELPIADGSVTIDGTSDGVLRTVSLTVAPDPDAWAWLATPGAEIRVARGLTLEGGDEYASLGVFVIDTDLDESPDGSIPVEAGDRSIRISRAKWIDPYTVAAGADAGEAIAALLTDRWPACPVGFGTLGKPVAAACVFQAADSSSDPWADARSIAKAVSLDLYFDADGVAQLRQIPDVDAVDPCMTYLHNDADAGLVMNLTRKALLSRVYSGAIVTAEGTGSLPLRGVCWDDDPTSPTYRHGPLGQVPYLATSSLIGTQDDADAAAASAWASVKRRMQQLSFELVPNPALGEFDVLELVEGGTSTRCMIDVISIPLASGNSSVTTREAVSV